MAADGVSDDELLAVEVVYAKPDEQVLLGLDVKPGISVLDVVNQTGILERFPELQANELKIGIFGVLCKPEQVLKAGDRVEIYRPLLNDPKEARRRRALSK